ncbi:hypothetical protein CLW00_11629 [Mongoliibacter ruber]|uniref:Uncharacterized protein n=1 Tax=Mongoliibacter ruber TaxID=1750599 RepID=A0A2T0WDT5_9BACT|nr:hypothetical protein CLW00_11629 [Mongoliibacter ruber]
MSADLCCLKLNSFFLGFEIANFEEMDRYTFF